MEYGSYSQFSIANRNHLIPLNYESLIEEKACIPEAYLTAYNLIKQNINKIEKENCVAFVNAAAGGVGLALVQILTQVFNKQVFASCS